MHIIKIFDNSMADFVIFYAYKSGNMALFF